jgi:methionyl aminopeptidase
MKVVKADAPLRAIGQAVEEVALRTGFTVIRNLGSHGIGHALHEEPKFVPSFDHPQETRTLQQGTVLTLEPFLTTGDPIAKEGDDGWTLRNVPGSLTAQYEHTVVVTRGKPLVLTQP